MQRGEDHRQGAEQGAADKGRALTLRSRRETSWEYLYWDGCPARLRSDPPVFPDTGGAGVRRSRAYEIDRAEESGDYGGAWCKRLCKHPQTSGSKGVAAAEMVQTTQTGMAFANGASWSPIWKPVLPTHPNSRIGVFEGRAALVKPGFRPQSVHFTSLSRAGDGFTTRFTTPNARAVRGRAWART